MKLLVSLCNRGSWETAILGPFLVELSVASGEVRPIDLKVSWPTGTTGIMGLAHLGEDLLAVTQGPSALLLCLTRDYRLRSVWPLAQVRDAHSLAVRDGLVYVASTGTDRVIEFDLRRGSERVFWQANHHGNDSIHLNSLRWHRGELLATTFGPKKGDDWRSADDGRSFSRVSGGSGAELYAAAFDASGERGLAVGRAGAAWLSEDGGKSWRDCRAGVDRFLGAVAWLPDGTALVGGEGGMALRFDPAGCGTGKDVLASDPPSDAAGTSRRAPPARMLFDGPAALLR